MKTDVLENRLDDLTVIKGIKDARQAWLRDHMQVKTYADLAALSVREIEATLKANGRLVARKTIESWIETADKLVQEVEVAEEQKPPTQPERLSLSEWQPFASFVVEFQERKPQGASKEQRTKVHYMELDDGTSWSGLAHGELTSWIKDRVGETVQLPQVEEADPEPVLVSREPVQVTVKRLIARQPPESEVPQAIYEYERPFQGFLEANCPFSATIELMIENLAEGESFQALGLEAELHARNMLTGANLPMALTFESLGNGQNLAAATLREGILSAGHYRFGLLVKQAQPRGIQFVELPLLQLV